MAILGPILKEVVKRTRNFHDLRGSSTYKDQLKVLRRLLTRARYTAFGREYSFREILKSSDLVESYQKHVPVFDYNAIHDQWWYRNLADEENVTWPGRVKYYALSSGTSQASSKKIPITAAMLKSIRRVGLRHTVALTELGLPPSFYEKNILMLAGSSKLIREGKHYIGDLSGILTRKMPIWVHNFYRPGRKIGKERDWGVKIEKMVEKADTWDIGIISGNPAWLQILMERIIARYNLNNIHDIWPNLKLFLHGGVSMKPYRNRLDTKIFGKEVFYLETYLASEGFLATQSTFNSPMRLVVDSGIFFEFIPFNRQNFSPDGHLLPGAEVLSLNKVQDGQEYAILISTCAGTWRYMIGDTVRFHDASRFEISITGRTRHYLSLCGEHLSVENMTEAVARVAGELGVDINEFAVVGVPAGSLFAHKWYIACDEPVSAGRVGEILDESLKELNDDYVVERSHALKELIVEIQPHDKFYGWLRSIGKEGGQHKFPRVLNQDQHRNWEEYLNNN